MLRLVLPAMPTHWTRAWVATWACIASLFLGSAQAGTNLADPAKVLRMAFPAAETGFDPVRVSDLYSNIVNSGIFQPLVTYDWMARPSTIVAEEKRYQGHYYASRRHTMQVNFEPYVADLAAEIRRGAKRAPRLAA